MTLSKLFVAEYNRAIHLLLNSRRMALSHSLAQGSSLLCELPNPGLGLVGSGSKPIT